MFSTGPLLLCDDRIRGVCAFVSWGISDEEEEEEEEEEDMLVLVLVEALCPQTAHKPSIRAGCAHGSMIPKERKAAPSSSQSSDEPLRN